MKKFKEKQKERGKPYLMLLSDFCIFIILFILSSCRGNVQVHTENSQKDNILNKKEFSKKISHTKKDKDTTFYFSKGEDEILSYTPNEDVKEVEFSWKLPNKDSIMIFLKRFSEISTQEWNMCYGTFQSNVKGYLRYKNHIYEYEVNAGGWIYLSSKEKTKIFGSKDKKDTINNFISVYYCDEME